EGVALDVFRSGFLIGYCEDHLDQGSRYHVLTVWRIGSKAPVNMSCGSSRTAAFRNLKNWIDIERSMNRLDSARELLMPTDALPVISVIVDFLNEVNVIRARLAEGCIADEAALEMKATIDKVGRAVVREFVKYFPN